MEEKAIEYRLARLLDKYFEMKKEGGYLMIEKFVEQEIEKAREEVYTDLIKEFDMLKEEDRVAKWFILGILKEDLSKLTTK